MEDESAVTYTEYLIATLAIVIGAMGASRMIVNALIQYLKRIYWTVTLPIP
jgi:hypothetical protein